MVRLPLGMSLTPVKGVTVAGGGGRAPSVGPEIAVETRGVTMLDWVGCTACGRVGVWVGRDVPASAVSFVCNRKVSVIVGRAESA
jgi:hypothetical protein